MEQICGIDEAGYGPTLGPLAIVAVGLPGADHPSFNQFVEEQGLPIRDSKKLYTAGKIAKLEMAALAGLRALIGMEPAHAAELFALLGENQADREPYPWLHGAEALSLPIAASVIPDWRFAQPGSVSGRLIHPWELNDAASIGRNKADLECEAISDLLRGLPSATQQDIAIDRLGGRRYYSDLIRNAWPNSQIIHTEEVQARSSYEVRYHDQKMTIGFRVKGEDFSALTALASIIAKYAREIHMQLLNNYWSKKIRGLKKTAGYPQDAKRWLFQLGAGQAGAHAHALVRGSFDYQKLIDQD